MVNKGVERSKYYDDIAKLYAIYGSQKKVAEKLGVNQSTISRHLTGISQRFRNEKKVDKKLDKIYNKIDSIYYYRYRVKFYSKSQNDFFWLSTDLVTYDRLQNELEFLLKQIRKKSDDTVKIVDYKLNVVDIVNNKNIRR